MDKIAIGLSIVIIYTLGSFLGTALIVWLLCLAFGLTFAWSTTFGIWLLLGIARSIFKRSA